ncbi:cell division protein FtsA [Alistipes sp.]|uniref:cell division protein FtsA n=1 Tax=Alistipes sp. TaxID=1872444 RepID=UPI0025BE2DA6|nr:cell division protein FtsA [Alistipes sp.]
MEKKNYTVAVDLGCSSVVVAVGEKMPEGLLDVACVVTKPVEGVNAGRIENIELVSCAIREAVAEAEQQLGIRITEAYAGISGDFVRCARHTDHVFVYDPQNGVNQKDVDALFDRMRNVQAPDDETIMERVPQNYMVDDSQEVRNPVGSFGKKLSSTFNFILCLKTPMQRLDMALKRLGIRMLGVMSDALATAEAVLLPDEKEEGVAVVDVGGGVTDVTVYYRNVVRYVASIPMGASAINRDIRTMSVPEKHVESLKQKYGSAVAELAPEDKLIRVNGRTAREAKDILLRNLATVIEARATDIAEFVQQEIKDSGYAGKLAYGIVLTGGSSKLKDLDELFRRVTGMDVRVALPEAGITEEAKEKVADAAFSTAVGILLKGAELGGCAVIERSTTPRPEMHRPFTPTQPAAGGFKAPQPRAARPYTPPVAAPEPDPGVQSGAEAAEAAGQPTEERVDETLVSEPKRSRNWGAIFQKTFDKINKSFSAAEDEEI